MEFAYFDAAATTPVCPEAAQAALEVMTGTFGNPSARYALGSAAAQRLQADRSCIASVLGCGLEELVFTSCGTEGDNWAVRAAAALGARRGRHIITTAIEHAAVLEPLRALEQEGWCVTRLKPDRTGHISVEAVQAALRPETVLVSMMLVNNELGTIQPVAKAVQAVKAYDRQILFHTDAVQGFLKIPFTPAELGVDLLTLSGHKIGAPKGIGVQYIRSGLSLPPFILGGGQEGGSRSGTEPTAQIAALAAACRAWKADYPARLAACKETALHALTQIHGLEVITSGDVPHICTVSLPGYPSEMLVRALGDRGVYVSAGSACHRGKPSHVFAALGLPKRNLMGALRISFSPQTTQNEIARLCTALREIMQERVPMK
ncbi:MAG: cysteine desulfurase [Oscillospiraceae bacterium]|nr:cysteine desulfurase [Oscillospiraceae bacterium]